MMICFILKDLGRLSERLKPYPCCSIKQQSHILFSLLFLCFLFCFLPQVWPIVCSFRSCPRLPSAWPNRRDSRFKNFVTKFCLQNLSPGFTYTVRILRCFILLLLPGPNGSANVPPSDTLSGVDNGASVWGDAAMLRHGGDVVVRNTS